MGSGPIRSVHGCLAHEMGQVGVALAIKAVSRHWTRRRHHAARRFYERYADHAVAVARLHGVALASQGGPSGLVGL
jgi:hypothetical protein